MARFLKMLTTITILMKILTMSSHLINADTICSNLSPGVTKMVRGVDITTLDLVPINAFNVRGMKNKIIDFTCNKNNAWTSPAGTEYKLPDQISHMTSIPGGWMATRIGLYQTSSDIRDMLNINAGVKGSFGLFSFSSSSSYKKMQTAITNTSKFIEDVSAFKSATRVDFVPNWVLQLDPLAEIYIGQLSNDTLESNRTGYNRFIREYGTHYFSTANFGGMIRTYMETNKQYVYSKSEREIKVSAKASFLNVISVHGGTVSGSTTVSKDFDRQTSTSVRYYGGNINLLKSDGIQQWQPTVDNDPWLLSGTLQPISDLISDENVKTNMIKAVNDHVYRSYLEELLRMTAAARRNMGNDKVIKNLVNRIETIKRKPILLESEVLNVSNDIKYHTMVPSWFMESTQLCYKWKPDRDCGSKRRLTCSKPIARTNGYKDDTKISGGGCRMPWAMTSVGAPSWFSGVKVCYRLKPTGDEELPKTRCALLNKYTAGSGKDNKDCRVSWKIVVPKSSPLWMKKARFCYNWNHDDRCGSVPIKTMCVTVNQWTADYNYKTKNAKVRTSGGCKMSWNVMMTGIALCSLLLQVLKNWSRHWKGR